MCCKNINNHALSCVDLVFGRLSLVFLKYYLKHFASPKFCHMSITFCLTSCNELNSYLLNYCRMVLHKFSIDHTSSIFMDWSSIPINLLNQILKKMLIIHIVVVHIKCLVSITVMFNISVKCHHKHWDWRMNVLSLREVYGWSAN
jgi:hypothetical protein